MRHVILAAILATVPAAVAAGPGDVNADEFYVDARDLMGKGVGAMFDKRTKPRMAQLKAAADTVKAENEAAERRGRALYCVSEAQRKKGMGAQKVVDMLGAVPAAQRKRSTLTQAWRAALIREYPCG